MAKRPHSKREDWELVRDVLLFSAGIVGVFYQLVSGSTNPSLLMVFAGMLGLPITLAQVRR